MYLDILFEIPFETCLTFDTFFLSSSSFFFFLKRHRCMERESFAMTVSYPLAPPNSLNALFKDDYTGLGSRADAVAEVDHNIGILVRDFINLLSLF